MRVVISGFTTSWIKRQEKPAAGPKAAGPKKVPLMTDMLRNDQDALAGKVQTLAILPWADAWDIAGAPIFTHRRQALLLPVRSRRLMGELWLLIESTSRLQWWCRGAYPQRNLKGLAL